MKLCVFQGTFNPIHNGHIKMAEHVLNNFDFDRILFIPAFRPPHKDYDESLTPHRLEMVKLATKENKKFEVSDIEYQNNRPSYTYLTILELYKKYDIDGKINFIIGTDAFKNINSWYEAEKLKPLIKFIVFKRENEEEIHIEDCDYKYSTMPLCDISSTEIRYNRKHNINIKDLTTEAVRKYIEENELYK
jgi:nicotinate-nucleotide adenylyltransferase